MKKVFRILLSVLSAFFIIWLTVFITDAVRTYRVKEPVFAFSCEETPDDKGTGLYKGLGYTVVVEKYREAETGPRIVSVEMRILGKVVAAAIE